MEYNTTIAMIQNEILEYYFKQIDHILNRMGRHIAYPSKVRNQASQARSS